MTAADRFDLAEYTRTAAGSHRAELALEDYDESPLTAETLRSLAYLRNVERATMSHLRGLLITPTHKDATVTAFLTTWAYEKFWIADALDGVIAWHEANGAPPAPQPLTLAPGALGARGDLRQLVGVDSSRPHLAMGVVDEWVTQAAYARILELGAPNERLAETLQRLRRQAPPARLLPRDRAGAPGRVGAGAAALRPSTCGGSSGPSALRAERREETRRFSSSASSPPSPPSSPRSTRASTPSRG